MPTYDRGGVSLKVGNIGKLSILRQIMLYPGETLKTKLKGHCSLSALRQQTSVKLDARMECFSTPIRWLQTDFPTYLQEGLSTAVTIATHAAPTDSTEAGRASELGIGHIDYAFSKFWIQAPIKIWNEWFRWGEDTRLSVTTPTYAMYGDDGLTCVNLPSHATRMHTAPTFDASEYLLTTSSTLDVRDLALYQARFGTAAKTDWQASDNRYNVYMRDIHGAKGSPEVDQIPTKLKGGTSLSVQPRDVYATDAAGLGEKMSLSNFSIDNDWPSYTAREHEIITFVMVLRFLPLLEDAPAPGIYVAPTNYNVFSGDPAPLMGHKPVSVTSREIDQGGDGTVIGYLPAGWQARQKWNHIDRTIRLLGNFPLLDAQTQTAAGYRDASKINEAFRTEALKHWYADLNFSCSVNSRIPEAGQSIMAGSGKGTGGLKGNHPHGGNLI